MNLKEAFRYQKFLDGLMSNAVYSLLDRDHALKTTKTHLRNAANAEAENVTEVVVPIASFFPNDDVIRFMQSLVSEKEMLCAAIGKAKASAGFDIDAAIESNKFQRQLANAVKNMLHFQPQKVKQSGRDYKFDINGVQVPYVYDVELVTEEAFDRVKSKEAMREAVSSADKVSAEIDAALINVEVRYTPPYNVNDTFDDVMAEFTKAE